LVFQDFRLLPWKTVYQNVLFAVKPGDRLTADARIERWLRLVGLAHRRDAWPKTLSGGERGRVAFVRALVDHPKVLLLDEPFRGLDVMTKLDLQAQLLNALAIEPAAVVLVSHSVEDAVYLSDTIHVLTDAPMRI